MITQETSKHLRQAAEILRDFVYEHMSLPTNIKIDAEFKVLYNEFSRWYEIAMDEGMTMEDLFCLFEQKDGRNNQQFVEWFMTRVERINENECRNFN